MNKGLAEIERARGFLDALNIKDEWATDMQARVLILESHHSTHIEGTAISLEQAESILTGKKVEGVSRDVEKELLNYKKAMDFISKYLGKDDPISEELVQKLHKTTVSGVRGGKAQPGSYREIQNYIAAFKGKKKTIIYTPPHQSEVPRLMKELMDWINGNMNEVSPVLVAGIAQFQFVHIHPFVDGNGRSARLLSTLILYKTGYDFKRLFTISEYYDKNRPAYYAAIQAVRKNKMDMTGWLEYFVDGLHSQMKDMRSKGERIIIADKIVRQFADKNLNDRQEKIVRHLVVNAKITNDECQRICGSIRRTATRDLSALVKKGIIKMEGELRSAYYVLSHSIEK